MNTTSKATVEKPQTPARDAQSLRFERRHSLRHPAGGQVTMLRRNHEAGAYLFPICSIQLIDMSDGGVGARTDVPLKTNEPVAVFIPPHGNERGFDLYGHVVRCDPASQGYHVGIAFDYRPAA